MIDALQSLDTAGAWLRLTRVDEINEDFRDICETFYSDISKLLGRDIRSDVMKTFVTLFITSAEQDHALPHGPHVELSAPDPGQQDSPPFR